MMRACCFCVGVSEIKTGLAHGIPLTNSVYGVCVAKLRIMRSGYTVLD